MALRVTQRDEHRSDGSWDWSVWLDGPDRELDGISHVVYTLHPTYPHPVRTVTDRATRFRLDASGWDGFRLYATTVDRDGGETYLIHDLELEGPDSVASGAMRNSAPAAPAAPAAAANDFDADAIGQTRRGRSGRSMGLARALPILSRTEVSLLAAYLVLLAVVGVYGIVVSWPDGSGRINLFWGDLAVVIPAGREVRLVLVALFTGAAGALLQSAPSIVAQARGRPLARWWGWWYLIRPFTGMMFALGVYLTLRTVLFAPAADAQAVNTYGVAALGAAVGLFSARFTSQLQRMFDRFFADSPSARSPRDGSPGDGSRPSGGAGESGPSVAVAG